MNCCTGSSTGFIQFQKRSLVKPWRGSFPSRGFLAFRRQRAGGKWQMVTHVLKRGIEIRTPYFWRYAPQNTFSFRVGCLTHN
jgi:hypothetical protein